MQETKPMPNTSPTLNDQMPLDINLDQILSGLSADEKESMMDSLMMMNEAQRVLSNTKHSIVTEILRFTERFEYWKHVPPKDVLDGNSASQFYYHAHPAANDDAATKRHDGEHGHFHSFMRKSGILESEKPFAALDYDAEKDDPKKHTCHIIGIAMDKAGNITGLFTTNRWVTGEVWYKADDVIAIAERFEIDHAQPSWPVNLWVSNCMKAFQPVIKALLIQRDKTIADWIETHGTDADYNVFEDRRLEVLSYCPINLVTLHEKLS